MLISDSVWNHLRTCILFIFFQVLDFYLFILLLSKKAELMELNTYLCLNIPDWFFHKLRNHCSVSFLEMRMPSQFTSSTVTLPPVNNLFTLDRCLQQNCFSIVPKQTAYCWIWCYILTQIMYFCGNARAQNAW